MVWLEAVTFIAVVAGAGMWWWHRDGCSWEQMSAPRGRAVLAAHGVAFSLLVQRNVSWFSTGQANLVEWLVLASAAAVAVSALGASNERGFPSADRWYGYFLLALIPGAIVATEPGASITALARSATGLVAVAALHITAPGRANRLLARDWAQLVAVLAVVGNLVFALGRDADLPYASALIVPRLHPNDVGFVGVVLVAFSLLPIDSHDAKPGLSVGWLFVGWPLVIFGHYRIGLGGLILVIAGAWTTASRRVRAALIGGWVFTLLLSEVVFRRLRIVTRGGDSGIQVAGFRRPIWEAALEQATRAPFIGRGINSVAEHEIRPTLSVPIPWGQLRQVHNTWLDVIVSGGALAFVFWSGFVFYLVMAARRWLHKGLVVPVVILACAGLDSLVDPVDRLGWVWLLTMVIVGGMPASGLGVETHDAPQA